jgi:hypothetical protein
MKIISFIEDERLVKKILKSAGGESNWPETAIPA